MDKMEFINKNTELQKKSGIYKIRNKHNKRFYIGSAFNFKKRFAAHKSALILNKHKNKFLQNDVNKLGIHNFIFEIIELVEKKELLIQTEQKYLDIYFDSQKICYNFCKDAKSFFGCKHSDITKEKIRSALTGKEKSKLHKTKLSIANKGKKLSKETRKKISNSNKGKIHTQETKNKISKSNLGKQHTKETKEKISKANKGKTRTSSKKREQSLKVSGKNNPMFGHKHKNSSKEKMSSAKKGKYCGKSNPMWNKKQTQKTKKLISASNSKPVLQYSLEGDLIKKWHSLTSASKSLKINLSSISACCNKRYTQAGGFRWTYLE